MVFRFYLWPFLERAFKPQERVWLDLDEMESASRRRLAELCGSKGELEDSRRLHREAAAYERLEQSLFPRFEQVFASSAREADHAQRVHPGRLVQVLPNTYPFDRPCARRPAGAVFRLLFVGTLGYAPNRDAFDHLCGSILPLLRAEADRPVELHVAGSGSASLEARGPGIILHGYVEELAPLYEACDVVVVPLRTGGGTRIKILEAFSHRRAVVSTMIGMEGLEAQPGRDLLAAETPRAFADACLHLLQDDAERSRIAEHGHRYFRERHSPEVLASAIRSL